jgi:hypothetical protein
MTIGRSALEEHEVYMDDQQKDHAFGDQRGGENGIQDEDRHLEDDDDNTPVVCFFGVGAIEVAQSNTQSL